MTPQKLKAAIKEAGVTQLELTKEADVSRFKLSMYLNEYGELTNDELFRLNEVLSKKGASQNGNRNRRK